MITLSHRRICVMLDGGSFLVRATEHTLLQQVLACIETYAMDDYKTVEVGDWIAVGLGDPTHAEWLAKEILKLEK